MGTVKKRELFSREVAEFRDKPLSEDTVCLSDIVSVLGKLSEHCATLEYQNNGNESMRAVKVCWELEKNVSMFRKRMRNERADILLNKK